jgi:hypothetical protein
MCSFTGLTVANISPVAEPVPQIDPCSAMSSTPNTRPIHEFTQLIISAAMELNALLLATYPGDEGRSGQMCEGGGVCALAAHQKGEDGSHKARRRASSGSYDPLRYTCC